MKNILIIVLSIVAVFQLNAQDISKQVVANAGNSASAGAYQIEQTIGEAMVTTHTQGNFTLCQGFQQKDGKITVSIRELDNYEFNYYPNPIVNELNIVLQAEEKEIETIIIDQAGKIVQQQVVQNKQQLALDFSSLAQGIYFVQLTIQNKAIRFEVLKR